MKLVIVESPAKAKTIGGYLGREYRVKASRGHVRDLPQKALGVDVEANFAPTYQVSPGKGKIVAELRSLAKEAEMVYLATDPDREGEAIAWHLAELLKLPAGRLRRVRFHQITPTAIRSAFASAGKLDNQLIAAQGARRIIDRLVGYQVSPVLWGKVARGASAGRVQTAALRLVVEREREIAAFVPVEYWVIWADLAKQKIEDGGSKIEAHGSDTPAILDPRSSIFDPFRAWLWRIGDAEAKVNNEAEAKTILAALEGCAWAVKSVEVEEEARTPFPPFTTSSLQQAASGRLRMSPKRTMQIAQALYEGIDIGEGKRVGLITYMRTDSTHVASEAISEARAWVEGQFGSRYLPEQARHYKSRVANAQEAHEAIRPTAVARTPAQMKPFLDAEQARVYDLIWRRFVASQMAAALYQVTTVIVATGDRQRHVALPYLFRAIGRQIQFDGFLKVYGDPPQTKTDATEESALATTPPLPPLMPREFLDLIKLDAEQRFTQPPPRYSEAKLIKALERLGIGRPSTYAPIMDTLKARGYVELQERSLVPSELGNAVTDTLLAGFPAVFDYGFTAEMEEALDAVARAEKPQLDVLQAFYEPLKAAIASARDNVPERKVASVMPAKARKKTVNRRSAAGGPARSGRTRKAATPEHNGREADSTSLAANSSGLSCPQCGKPLVERRSKYGPFLGCSGFPVCRYIHKAGTPAATAGLEP